MSPSATPLHVVGRDASRLRLVTAFLPAPHLPRSLPLTRDLAAAGVLGITPVIAALDAIETGDTSPERFTTIGGDWDAERRGRARLDRPVWRSDPSGSR